MSSSGPHAAASFASASTSSAAATASTSPTPGDTSLPSHFVRLTYLDPSPKKGWLKQLLAAPRGASALPPLRLAELAPLQELLRCGTWLDDGHPFRELAAGVPHVQLYLARSAERLQPMLFISRAHVERLAVYASAAMRARQPGAWARELHVPASRPGTWARDELVSITPVAPSRVKDVVALRSNIAQELERVEAAQPQPSYVSWPAAYDSLRALWQRATLPSAPVVPLLLAVDVETWEMSHQGSQKDMDNPTSWALEIGWSLISPSTPRAGVAPAPWSEQGGSRRPMKDAGPPPPRGSWMQESYHYLVDRHYPARKNGRYCADQRHNFLFGPPSERSGAGREAPYKNGSRIASMEDITSELNATLLLARDTDTPVFVTFHDAGGDLPTLQGMGIPTGTWLRGPQGIQTVCNWLPGSEPAPICVLDTSALIAALRSDDYGTHDSLGTVALALNVNDGVVEGMHNAANDAFYTAAIGATLAAGPPLPQMRALLQPRWEAAKEHGKKRAPAQHGAVLAKQDEQLPEEVWLSPWATAEPTPARAVTDKLASLNEVRALGLRIPQPQAAAPPPQQLDMAAAPAAAGSSNRRVGATKQPTVATAPSAPVVKASEPVDPVVMAAARQAAAQAPFGARAQLVAQARAASQLRSTPQLKASPPSQSLAPRQSPPQPPSPGVPLRSARVQAASSSAPAQPATADAATASTSKLKTWPAPASRTTQSLADVLLNEQRREAAAQAKGMASQEQQSPTHLAEGLRGSKRDAPSSPAESTPRQRAKTPHAPDGNVELDDSSEHVGRVANARWRKISDWLVRRCSDEDLDSVSLGRALGAFHEYRRRRDDMVFAAAEQLGYEPVVFFHGEGLNPLLGLHFYRKYRTEGAELRNSFDAAWKKAYQHFNEQPLAHDAKDKLRLLKEGQSKAFWASAPGRRLVPMLHYSRSKHAERQFGAGFWLRTEVPMRQVEEARLRAERLGEWSLTESDVRSDTDPYASSEGYATA